MNKEINKKFFKVPKTLSDHDKNIFIKSKRDKQSDYIISDKGKDLIKTNKDILNLTVEDFIRSGTSIEDYMKDKDGKNDQIKNALVCRKYNFTLDLENEDNLSLYITDVLQKVLDTKTILYYKALLAYSDIVEPNNKDFIFENVDINKILEFNYSKKTIRPETRKDFLEKLYALSKVVIQIKTEEHDVDKNGKERIKEVFRDMKFVDLVGYSRWKDNKKIKDISFELFQKLRNHEKENLFKRFHLQDVKSLKIIKGGISDNYWLRDSILQQFGFNKKKNFINLKTQTVLDWTDINQNLPKFNINDKLKKKLNLLVRDGVVSDWYAGENENNKRIGKEKKIGFIRLK